MKSLVYVKQFPSHPYNKKEILRYMGADKNSHDESLNSLIDECICECEEKNTFSNKICYSFCNLSVDNNNIKIDNICFESKIFSKKLSKCDNVIIFAATIGIGIDRLVERYSLISPSKALVFQAIGAERIESLCDAFCDEIKSEYATIPRFSPGYGDIQLETQKDIFATLECEKNIGLTLLDSMLMSPTKSVTAFIGIKKKGI